MKLTTLLKEVQKEKKSYMSVDLEFETDAHGNLEIWSGDHEDLLAVVDRKRHLIDYIGHPWGTYLPDTMIAAIEAAAQRFLDDESDPSDPTAMYADRFPDEDDDEWIDPAGGTHRGGGDPAAMYAEESATATVSKKPLSPVQWFADNLEKELESKAIPLPYKTFQRLLQDAKQKEELERQKAYNEGYVDGRNSVITQDYFGDTQFDRSKRD